VVVVALVVAVVGGLASHGLAQLRSRLSGFMRPKLDHSKHVLEGIALGDFDLIAKNARAMKELSEAAEWRVTPDITYLGYSREFQRLADELVQQAKEKDIDGATLAYVQLTLNCVNCHKLVRENKFVTARPRGDVAHETRVR
jgi:hypothetical protein